MGKFTVLRHQYVANQQKEGADRTAGRITAAGGSLAVLADDAAFASGTSGTALSGTVFLINGLHTLKGRSTGRAFNVTNILAVGENIPAAPTITGLSESNGTAAVTWNAVAGASGSVVRYGTATGMYDQRIDVGNATSRSVPGLANNTALQLRRVGIHRGRGGEPAARPAAGHRPARGGDGRSGAIGVHRAGVRRGVGAGDRDERCHRRRGGGERAVPRGLSLGNGWVTEFFTDRFSSGVVGNEVGHVARRRRHPRPVLPVHRRPTAGRRLSLNALNFQAWFPDGGNPNTRVGLPYRSDGTNFTDVPLTGTIGNAAGLTADLSGIPALQNGTGTVSFRIYTWGANNYTTTGFGLGTSANDLVVRGSTTPTSPYGAFTSAGEAGRPAFHAANGIYTVTGGGGTPGAGAMPFHVAVVQQGHLVADAAAAVLQGQLAEGEERPPRAAVDLQVTADLVLMPVLPLPLQNRPVRLRVADFEQDGTGFRRRLPVVTRLQRSQQLAGVPRLADDRQDGGDLDAVDRDAGEEPLPDEREGAPRGELQGEHEGLADRSP